MRHRKKILTLLVVVLLALVRWGLPAKPYVQETKVATGQVAGEKINSSTAEGEWATVKRAVDGDTIELTTGEKVRYIGMDTPETVKPNTPVQCYGKAASDFNTQLVTGKKVRLVKDVSETDRYGRLLRYVYLEDGTFVNELLVQQGYARVETIPPDVRYSDLFVQDARQAQAEQKGLWAVCK